MLLIFQLNNFTVKDQDKTVYANEWTIQNRYLSVDKFYC